MLSGETAIGDYPVETVRMMDRIAQAMGAGPRRGRRAYRGPVGLAEGRPVPEAVGRPSAPSCAPCLVRSHLLFDQDRGSTARVMRASGPRCRSWHSRPFPKRNRSLSLIWGVTPSRLTVPTVKTSTIARSSTSSRSAATPATATPWCSPAAIPSSRAAPPISSRSWPSPPKPPPAWNRPAWNESTGIRRLRPGRIRRIPVLHGCIGTAWMDEREKGQA